MVKTTKNKTNESVATVVNDCSPHISIIIPTYQEVKNLPALAEKIQTVLAATEYTYEIIISDDSSNDGTDTVCAELAKHIPLRLLSRTSNRGLSPAVIDGIKIATGTVVLVMDADLSHPPEKIPDMAELLLSHQADFVVGSRYVDGGALDAGWPWWRRLNSLVATLPAKWLVPLLDPMSGFFGLRRADMPDSKILSPIGYKIALELCVKGNFSRQRVREVPIHFRDRQQGESKMNLREQVNYLRHLRRLYHYRWSTLMEILQFLVVGLSGLVVDVACYLLLQAGGVPHLLARAISYWPAVTSNWFLNRIMTFKERPSQPAWTQWMQYALFSGIGFLINWGVYALLTENINFFKDYLILALFAGVLAGTVFNFLCSNWIIFRRHQ